MLAALDLAGPRPASGTSEKRNWGTRFADACATMFANELRQAPELNKLAIRPNADGSGRESLTGVGGRGKKKVDVIASTLSSGLQIALSLKAENFADKGSFGKNLMNRLYELQDEVRAIHEYQPRAYVVGVLFLPLAATQDRAQQSSFARSVANLRSRTGRSDFSSPTQWNKLDWSVIGLYGSGDVGDVAARGAVRYFDVGSAPPRVGRPAIDTTLDLDAVIATITQHYLVDGGELIDYAEPEAD
ncbi:MAG: hypothetical protein JJU22_00585 [Gammaproteobacteria bacterium]|nr:hypothetical protein [Gammaproteobacteria bacterium]